MGKCNPGINTAACLALSYVTQRLRDLKKQCKHSKTLTCHRVIHPKDADGIANSEDSEHFNSIITEGHV